MDPSYLVYVFAGRIPMIILLIAGIVFAMARWNRHPKVSFLTILGLLFYLLESTFFTLLIYLMPTALPMGRWVALSETVFTVLYVLDDIAYAAVLIVLVAAAFSQRANDPADPLVSTKTPSPYPPNPSHLSATI